eukprot:TRINITY_DN17653_c0_g1_i3.p1 TRINITY_DN17653_c0_g1~~TRINITY_DN17653_c0_g1_i3.p1  ORF type:complete len:103 (+),score=20.96 TRINITY_DN17653_c0_g1_i3:673-981(+)
MVRQLQEVFGTAIRWTLLVYNVRTKSSELAGIENCIVSMESERNNTVHSISAKKTLLLKNSEKVVETGKKHERLSQILLLSLIHICRCRRYAVCRSRWSPYH